MKKLLSVLLLACLLAPCAVADDDWFYPFGLTSQTTYQEAVDMLKDRFPPAPDFGYLPNEEFYFTGIYPENSTLFDLPIRVIVVSKARNGDMYSTISFSFEVPTESTSASKFLAIAFGLMDVSKTSIVDISPHSMEYGRLNTFMDDTNKFTKEYAYSPEEAYSVSWQDLSVEIQKKSGKSEITVVFYNKYL